MKNPFTIGAVLLGIFLAACGGGGGGTTDLVADAATALPQEAPNDELFGVWTFKSGAVSESDYCKTLGGVTNTEVKQQEIRVVQAGASGCDLDGYDDNGESLRETKNGILDPDDVECSAGGNVLIFGPETEENKDPNVDCQVYYSAYVKLELKNGELDGAIKASIKYTGTQCGFNAGECLVTIALSATKGKNAHGGVKYMPVKPAPAPQPQPQAQPQPNRAPVIQTVSLPDATEDQQYSIFAQAFDPDGDPITFSLTSAPAGLQVDGGTGELTWNMPIQADVGSHPVVLQVADIHGAVAEQDFFLEVINVNDPPVLDVQPLLVVVDEGEEVVLSARADDEDGDAVQISYSGWMNDFRYQTNFNDAGQHQVVVSATDGQATVQETVTVVVNDINRAPLIDPIPDMTIREGELIEIHPVASDPDGNVPNIVYGGWLTGPVYQTNYNDAGVYLASVTASDGNLSTTVNFTITVLDVNREPVFPPQQEQFTLEEGEILEFTVQVDDPDGHNIALALPAPVSIVDNFSNGRMTVIPGLSDSGQYQQTVEATDDGVPPLSASANFNFQVTERWREVEELAQDNCGCDPQMDAGFVAYCEDGIVMLTDANGTIPVSDGLSTVDDCPKISGQRVVWSGTNPQGVREVYLFEGVQTLVVSQGDGYSPDLHGKELVWIEGSDSDSEIWYQDPADNVQRLTNDRKPDKLPKIHDGEIAWVHGSTVMLRDEVGNTVALGAHKFFYSLNLGGGVVAWSAANTQDAVDREIYAYNGQTRRLTQNNVRDDGVFVADDGSVLWYQEGPAGGIYQSADGIAVSALTSSGEQEVGPSRAGGMTVWRRSIQGTSGVKWRVYAHRNGRFYILDKEGFNGNPATDGTAVVWTRLAGTKEIYRTEYLP